MVLSQSSLSIFWMVTTVPVKSRCAITATRRYPLDVLPSKSISLMKSDHVCFLVCQRYYFLGASRIGACHAPTPFNVATFIGACDFPCVIYWNSLVYSIVVRMSVQYRAFFPSSTSSDTSFTHTAVCLTYTAQPREFLVVVSVLTLPDNLTGCHRDILALR